MGLLIIVPLLVSGYMVCIRHPFFYVRLHRFQGQLLYLHVARMEMACLIVSTLLSAAILAMSKQALPILGHLVATDYSNYLGTLLVQLDIASEKNGTLWVFLMQVGLTALVIPFFWSAFYVGAKKKILQLETDVQLHTLLALGVLEGTPFRILLRESIVQCRPCMFSLNDRKVYVGIVLFAGTPTESEGVDHAFTLIPILSGYRDKDTLEVTLNTHYSTAANPPPITLIQENVVSATQFDFTLWNAVHTRKTRKPRQGECHQHRPARPMHAESLCA
ncbi:hypothetical protein [Pseudomonas sp. DWRC2-2]|uniref:hypothetical protein n=1 Tax=Pseudomonas sp. DWRC2-2 TaxID=2804567 RepID=UPI003CEF08A6